MNIEEKLEELQKDIAYMREDVLAIREYVVEISKELQKMQQPKVCKWKPEEEKKWFFYATECGKDYEEWDSDTIETLNFCPNCGGKIEIDKENPQK